MPHYLVQHTGDYCFSRHSADTFAMVSKSFSVSILSLFYLKALVCLDPQSQVSSFCNYCQWFGCFFFFSISQSSGFSHLSGLSETCVSFMQAVLGSKPAGILFVVLLGGCINSCRDKTFFEISWPTASRLYSPGQCFEMLPWVNSADKAPLTSTGFCCVREMTQSQSCVGEIL